MERRRNLEYLADVGPRLVEKGFRQMKTQMGAEPSAEAEVARIRTLREALGPDIDLMCDINQLWDVNRSITIGRRVEEFNLFWLEDMTVHDDYQGLARIADALATPIAAGEYVFGITPFRQLIENRSIDIVMIDLMRVGGITQFQKVAGMAEAFNMAGGQPPSPGSASTQHRRHSQRADRRVYALVAATLRGNPGHRGRRNRSAGQAGAGSGLQPGRHPAVPG